LDIKTLKTTNQDIKRGESCDPIKQFNSATLLCLPQAPTSYVMNFLDSLLC